MRLLRLYVGLFMLTSAVSISAQKVKEHQEANQAFEYGYFNEAIPLYKKAFSKVKTLNEKAEIAFREGECHRYLSQYSKAATKYRQALKTNRAPEETRLKLADVLLMQERYSEAKTEYDKYFKEFGDDRGKLGSEACTLAQEWKDNPTRHEVNKVEIINGKSYDFAPAFYDKKQKKLVFSSTRAAGVGSKDPSMIGGGYPDLFVTTQDKKKKDLHKGWSEPELIDNNELVNTRVEESSASMDKKYSTIYFTRCPQVKKEQVGCEIWQAPMTAGVPGEPMMVENLKPADSTLVSVQNPFLSPDGKLLIFVSDIMVEGESQGGFDIWYAEYDRKSKSWGEPKNAGPEINSPGHEIRPTMDKAGNLFFASDYWPGMGGLDMFKAAKKEGEEIAWGTPENLQYPLNSSADDYGIIFKNNKQEGFFTSNRNRKTNKDDIYSFSVPPIKHTLLVKVIDADSGEPIEGVNVIVKGEDGDAEAMYDAFSTDASGSVSYVEIEKGNRYVKEEANYKITVEKKPDGEAGANENPDDFKILTTSQMISSKGLTANRDFVNVFKVKIVKNKIDLPMVYYELNKHALQVITDSIDSKDSLNAAYDILINNPTLKVKLLSHTDSRGGTKANQKLSDNRAKSCVCYLVFEKGINPTRLDAEGKGENDPTTITFEGKEVLLKEDFINQYKDKDEDTFEFLHQKNRRTELSILDWNWNPKTPQDELDASLAKWKKICKDLKVYDNTKLFKGDQAEENQK